MFLSTIKVNYEAAHENAPLKMTKLSEKTYWKVGGECPNFHEINEYQEIIQIIKRYNISTNDLVIIGNGTNVLFDSNGYDGHVIKLSESFDFINNIGDGVFELGASVWVPGLVRKLSILGYGGLEHCVGIPATFGGLVAMNGGSQRRSISERILTIKYVDIDGLIKEWIPDSGDFSYRDSPFKNTGRIILSVIVRCDYIGNRSNRKELISILSERRNKFPRKIPNCGSVFMSSPSIYNKMGPPGYIIESLGLKGRKIGGARISPLHANFIINEDNATSADIISLVNLINDECFKTYQFRMEAEAIYYESKSKPRNLSAIK